MVDAFWGYATRIYEPVEDFKKDWKNAAADEPAALPAAGGDHPADRGEPLAGDDRRGDARLSAHRRGGVPASSPGASPRRSSTGRSSTPGRCRGSGATARPRTGCATTTRPACRQGFAALGDSVCAFNPVYGVGMTLTGLEALALARSACATARGGSTARRFQKRGRQAGRRPLGADHRRGPPLAGDAGGQDHPQGEDHALVHRAGDPADPAERGCLPPLPGGQPHARRPRRRCSIPPCWDRCCGRPSVRGGRG